MASAGQGMNMTCKVCGTEYYACTKCIELMGKGIWTWKLDACTHECFRVYAILAAYKNGAMTAGEAMRGLDTENTETMVLTADVQRGIDEIRRAIEPPNEINECTDDVNVDC